ncbi:hypothetical protein HAX54_025768 [Datura stramonium]|uniref:Uncharacterized protein n=1 Tax=Datura stramonium TaxID=4076 RepID=A0ABS8S7K1_DATST|nr:hypothetical protein [Datura stramonium]
MGMPDGPPPATLTENQNRHNGKKRVNPQNEKKSSYAGILSQQTKSGIKARFSTHNGTPTVIFKASDYYGVMADECKQMLVGKFLRTKPQIEKIRSKFAKRVTIREDESTPLKGYSQKFEYETVPKFCKHCKLLGHSTEQGGNVERKTVEGRMQKNTKDDDNKEKIILDKGKLSHDQGEVNNSKEQSKKEKGTRSSIKEKSNKEQDISLQTQIEGEKITVIQRIKPKKRK